MLNLSLIYIIFVSNYNLEKRVLNLIPDTLVKKSESLQTEGRHFRSMICKLSDV